MRKGMAALLGSALIAGLCAGCASSTAPADAGPPVTPFSGAPNGRLPGGTQCPSGSKDPAIAALSAATGAPTPLGTPLPVDFRTVAVVRCEAVTQTIAGEGVWTVALAQRATGDLQPLLTALRLSSRAAPTDTQFACAAVGVVPPNFALVGAHGQIMRPSLPHDECGIPLPQALDALDALPWKTEAEQKLSQVQSPAEVETGCPNAYKYVFDFRSNKAVETLWPLARGSASVTPTTACEYSVSQASASGGVPVGAFERGVKLTSAQQQAIAAAYLQVGRLGFKPCASAATKFALLTVGTAEIAVELDGCQRTDYPDYSGSQTPASVLATLRAAGIH